MGPWLCSHGNVLFGPGPGRRRRLQWGRGCVATEMVYAWPKNQKLWASMGPWLCSHGNSILRIQTVRSRPASMGPWLCSHGNFSPTDAWARFVEASMGPWLCSHGN